MHDTIVVGGGPIGSYVAYRLADSGHSVSVLEMKSAAGEPVCCTGIVGQECADTFDIDERVILRRVNSASLYSPSGKRLYLRREEPQACILDRAAFDKAMADRAEGAGAAHATRCMPSNPTRSGYRSTPLLLLIRHAVRCRWYGATYHSRENDHGDDIGCHQQELRGDWRPQNL